jgi:hypothetical protein
VTDDNNTPILRGMAGAVRKVLSFTGATISHWEMNTVVWTVMADQLRNAEFERYLEEVDKYGALMAEAFRPTDYTYIDGVTLYGYPVRLSTRMGWRLCFTQDGKETAYDEADTDNPADLG